MSFPNRQELEIYNMRGNTLRSSRPANSMDQDSFDSFDDIEEMVMAANNLSLTHPNLGSVSEANRDSLNVSGEEDELPKSIIVTNVDLSVFDNVDIKVCIRIRSLRP